MTDLVQHLRLSSGLEADAGWWELLKLPDSLLQACRSQPHPRTASRLSRDLSRQLKLPAMSIDDPLPANVKWLNGQKINRVSVLAGAIWHASRLKWLISGGERSAVLELIGRDGLAFALRQSELCIVFGDHLEAGVLADSIRHDGRKCWKSWLATKPSALRSRLALLSPPVRRSEDRWNATQKEQGARIITRVLQKPEVWR